MAITTSFKHVRSFTTGGRALPIPAWNAHLIAFPLALPMGWDKSPPHFHAFTETIMDMSNECIREEVHYLVHPLEHLANAQPMSSKVDQHSTQQIMPPYNYCQCREPTAYVDLYFFDFNGVVQTAPVTQQVQCVVLHSVWDVLCSNNLHEANWKETISESKLAENNAAWSTQKMIFGRLIEMEQQPLELPSHHELNLHHS